jgi:uncharacterized Zn-finger protein
MAIHENAKKYICSYCSKTFSLPQYLREHNFTHTKELPYVCGVSGCTMRFRQAGKLCLHRRTHPEYQCHKYDYTKAKRKKTIRKRKSIGAYKLNDAKGENRIFEIQQAKTLNVDFPENFKADYQGQEKTHSQNLSEPIYVKLPLIPDSEKTNKTEINDNYVKLIAELNKINSQNAGLLSFMDYITDIDNPNKCLKKLVLPLPKQIASCVRDRQNHFDLFSLEAKYGKA